jgi:hypothetical protein
MAEMMNPHWPVHWERGAGLVGDAGRTGVA